MPRPTAAQLAYGSCTVIFSTLAMLLLSQTSSGLGIAVIALAALALGLLVAVTVPLPRSASAAAGRLTAQQRTPAGSPKASTRSAAPTESVREPANP